MITSEKIRNDGSSYEELKLPLRAIVAEAEPNPGKPACKDDKCEGIEGSFSTLFFCEDVDCLSTLSITDTEFPVSRDSLFII